jgi:hypothetical protein
VLLLKTFTIHCRGWRTQIVAEGVYPEKHFLCGRNPPPRPLPSFTLQAPLSFLTHVSEKERGERRGGRNWRALTFFGTNWGGMEAVLCEANDLRTKLDSNHQMTSHIHIWKNWTEGILMTFGSVSTHKSHWHSMMLFLWRK